MVSEVMNGLLKYQDGRHQILTSTRHNKPLTMGIIPAGKKRCQSHCKIQSGKDGYKNYKQMRPKAIFIFIVFIDLLNSF